MQFLASLTNLDLLAVGVTIAATAILGFVVYLNNTKSIVNKSFLLFSFTANAYGVLNYISYQAQTDIFVLWSLRLVIFSAVWYAYSLFQLLYVLTEEEKIFPKWYLYWLLPSVVIVSILNLTPFVFSGLSSVAVAGEVAKVIIAPGLAFFIAMASFLVIGALFILIKKTYRSTGIQRRQLKLILAGSVVTYLLIIIFNMLLPTVFQNVQYVKLAPIFALPFLILTSYTIIKYNMMNIKVISTEILVFVLSIATLIEVIFSDNLPLLILRSSIFVLVLSIGILLIRSVVREVQQREKIEKLAQDLERSNTELEVANERLKELDKQKTEFVSIASHQLRSPLTAIKGYSSMLLEGSFGKLSEKPREAVQVVFESSQKLVGVIEDFLNITRIELGKMKYEMSTIDMGKMVESVVNELKPNVMRRGLTMTFDGTEGPYNITGDAGKLNQVFLNVIDNAIKYTEKGSIAVTVARRQEGGKNLVRFTSVDTGVGMDQATIPKLFEKFVRATGAGAINITGTGLGLYVAKQIVEAHGGKIWAESDGKGKGSKFIVELEEKKG